MKKKCIFISFLFLLFLGTASAGSYYKGDDGNFFLCDSGGGCIPIAAGQSGANFDLRNEHIQYGGIDYYYDDSLQEKYYEDQVGLTRMFYYMQGEKYVLCKTKDSCKSYTFEDLESLGASIQYETSILFPSELGPGEPRIEYLFNRQVNNEGTGSTAPGTSGGVAPIEKPVYEAKTNYCTKLKEPLQFVGNVVLIVKILIPIIIIVFGMIDFFKAITGSKDDEIKKSARIFVFRCLSGVIIFFIPTIVSLVFSLVASFADIKGDFDACQKCIFRVSSCK